MANIIQDDGRIDSEGGGQWSAVLMDRFYGGGAVWPEFANDHDVPTGLFGTFSVSFYGTGIALHGNVPPTAPQQSFFVSIDSGTPYQTTTDSLPSRALQWYQSPKLSDDHHSLTFTHIAGTSIDYMVISAGPNTPLAGERLIVDDSDAEITYNGGWSRKEGTYKAQDYIGMPHGNATHQTGSVGSIATFLFTGYDVAIYSVFDFSHLGYVTVKYTIDGSSQTKTHSVTPSTSQYKDGILQQENTLLWESDDSLVPGSHKLEIEVMENDGQTDYVLDYIVYSPSFKTLALKPKIDPETQITTSPAGSTDTKTESTSTGTTNTTPPTVSGTATNSSTVSWLTAGPGTVSPTILGVGSTTSLSSGGPNGTSNTPPHGVSATKTTPVGAMVGGIIGGVAVVILLLLLALHRRRKSKLGTSLASSSQGLAQRAYLSVNPFTGTSPSMVLDTKSKPSWITLGMVAPSSSGSDAAQPIMTRQHKRSFSMSNPSVYATALAPNRYEQIQEQDSEAQVAGADSNIVRSPATGGGVFRSRMQRLQELVTELNEEIANGREGGVRAAELKGRIAELTREERQMGVPERSSMATTTVPPPYEPRRE